MSLTLWTYSELVPRRRQDALEAVESFARVIAHLKTASIDFVGGAEPRENPPCMGCSRAFFRLYVDERVYDAFFNSPVGYRAQFCIGAENGKEKNRHFLNAVEPMCLAEAYKQELPHFPASLVLSSLRGAGAKIWINEDDLRDLEGIHIEYPPWVAKVRAAPSGSPTEQAARSLASNGVLAPIGTMLEIKGAWIAPDGTECHDPRKAARAEEIRDYGFS